MIPETMKAMVTMGHGDFDMLVWHEDWPVPTAASGEVLIRVGACGLTNTDINTRTGWYSKAVSEATTGGAYDEVGSDDQSWGGAAVTFPRIQGADICGEIVALGDGVDPARIGERVITDNWLRDPADPLDKERTGYYGSEHDGGFAEYATIPATNALAVDSPLSDAELATFSCSYSTADGMLTRAAVTAGDTVLVPGASGGVGGARNGSLTFMAGGPDAGFALAAPLFEIMGAKAVHCGGSGAGQAAKICNNMILGATMIVTCEAFALADGLGLDRQKMFDVVSTSSGYSWSMNSYCPAPGVGPESPSDNGYIPGFSADLMLKDLRLALQAAQSTGADTPLGAAAQALYETFVEEEDGSGRDFSAMLQRFEKRRRAP